jgi:hypothetical protein
MGRSTRPRVVFGALHDASANRIALDIVEKHVGAAVSALRDVVGDSGENDPCDSRHVLRLAEAREKG